MNSGLDSIIFLSALNWEIQHWATEFRDFISVSGLTLKPLGSFGKNLDHFVKVLFPPWSFFVLFNLEAFLDGDPQHHPPSFSPKVRTSLQCPSQKSHWHRRGSQPITSNSILSEVLKNVVFLLPHWVICQNTNGIKCIRRCSCHKVRDEVKPSTYFLKMETELLWEKAPKEHIYFRARGRCIGYCGCEWVGVLHWTHLLSCDTSAFLKVGCLLSPEKISLSSEKAPQWNML